MAQELAQVRAIADNPAPATFDNTVAGLERSGKAHRRAGALYGIWTGTLSSPQVQEAGSQRRSFGTAAEPVTAPAPVVRSALSPELARVVALPVLWSAAAWVRARVRERQTPLGFRES